LQEFGILPRLDRVYRFDEKAPEVDAVFVSHAHLDHSAYLSFIKPEIPVYCGETTRVILQALSKMRRADLEFNIAGLNFGLFRTSDKIHFGNVEVEPVHVDHSVPRSYGFVVHTSNGAIVYTGDFRHHGAKREMTEDFVEKATEVDPQAVVTEATNMTGANVSSEAEAENKLSNIVAQADGICLQSLLMEM
jgi:ribonuclease J